MTPAGGIRDYRVVCASCTAPAAPEAYVCGVCGGPLVVEPAPLTPADLGSGLPTPEAGLWRWRALLPRTRHAVSLGEGGTPLVAPGDGLGDVTPGGVLLKLETLNPTLSFKDRAMALAASVALDRGAHGLVVASTGNAAVSAAAYAAAAGLACRIVVGKESNAAVKLGASRAYGAEVLEVPGDYSAAYRHAVDAEGPDWVNVSTTYRNPLLAEAYRPLAFELLGQLGTAPAAVVVPVGAGPLLRGIERGFADARDLGLIEKCPALVGVQAAAVAPVAHLWALRHPDDPAGWPVSAGGQAPADAGEPAGGETRATIATAIADRLTGYESHAQVTVDAVERSGGAVLTVPDDHIVAATHRLAAAGFWVEPSSATALAALDRMPARLRLGGPVVLVMTGHGVKAPFPQRS